MNALRLCLASVLSVSLAAAGEPCRYREAVRLFLDTMIEKGTDRYGPEHSPLFAAMLDLDRLALPEVRLPADYFTRDDLPEALGHGIPAPPVGIRPTDRSPLGNNLEHDIMLLKTLYAFSQVTGEPRYARHADAVLEFWLKRCQSPATGLMYSGEHASWNFLSESGYGDIYEVFRRFPFWDRLYSIDPARALRFADALWLHQIGDKRRGDFSRHARISAHGPSTGAAYPRHAGFYIWAYANAYAQTRDPKYVDRIELLVESRTSLRPQPYSLVIEPGSWCCEKSSDPTLRALLWDAAALVPSRRSAWRALVRQLDERAFAEPATELLSSSSGNGSPAPEIQPLMRKIEQSGRAVTADRGVRTISVSLDELWKMDYGDAGYSGKALLNYTRWQQTGDERFLKRVETAAGRYLSAGLPQDTRDLWPRAAGQVISLMLALAREKTTPPSQRLQYVDFARKTADLALRVFPKNGLFRADGSSAHYEAITGADDLLWALLQLDCELNGCPIALGHIDVNW
ncbi:MAG: hypothetical protein KatS3mg005_0412 [Bryobacteraceae bacterium]|nr:MAG: hypothetical protein KatS3mg005_0412 [Bryobacteraceae bacterium]